MLIVGYKGGGHGLLSKAQARVLKIMRQFGWTDTVVIFVLSVIYLLNEQ
jgi:hypothetical protein